MLQFSINTVILVWESCFQSVCVCICPYQINHTTKTNLSVRNQGQTATRNLIMLLYTFLSYFHVSVFEQAVYQDGESVGEPKFRISWSQVHERFRARPVSVQKDCGYMKALVAAVLSSVSDSNQGMDMRETQTQIMAPQDRLPRSQIIVQTQQSSRLSSSSIITNT